MTMDKFEKAEIQDREQRQKSATCIPAVLQLRETERIRDEIEEKIKWSHTKKKGDPYFLTIRVSMLIVSSGY